MAREDRSIFRVDLASRRLTPVLPRTANSLGAREKAIENLLVENPGLLFSEASAVLIIGQEVSGESLADVLAVDSQGQLIVVELKRGASDRTTVGQILDYSSRLASWTYDDFNERWQRHRKSHEKSDLFEHFKQQIDNPDFDRTKFLAERRMFILASSAEEGAVRILSWLRERYNVLIAFVPFQFFSDEHGLLVETERIPTEPITPAKGWDKDWFFNTNETYAADAYKKMLAKSVIALYGYPAGKGEAKLQRPSQGDRVFAYVNGHGVIAVGSLIDDAVVDGKGVFEQGAPREFHRRVKWQGIVGEEQALENSTVSSWGYNLPVRETVCKIYDPRATERMAEELRRRASAR